jgi:hypothetical protein
MNKRFGLFAVTALLTLTLFSACFSNSSDSVFDDLEADIDAALAELDEVLEDVDTDFASTTSSGSSRRSGVDIANVLRVSTGTLVQTFSLDSAGRIVAVEDSYGVSQLSGRDEVTDAGYYQPQSFDTRIGNQIIFNDGKSDVRYYLTPGGSATITMDIQGADGQRLVNVEEGHWTVSSF